MIKVLRMPLYVLICSVWYYCNTPTHTQIHGELVTAPEDLTSHNFIKHSTWKGFIWRVCCFDCCFWPLRCLQPSWCWYRLWPAMHVCVTDTLVLSGFIFLRVLFSLHSSECFKLYSTGQIHFILPFFHLCSNTSQQCAEVSDQFPAVETRLFCL